MTKVLTAFVLVLATGCGAEPAPPAPDAPDEPRGPLQMIERTRDVAQQVEDRYELLDQP